MPYRIKRTCCTAQPKFHPDFCACDKLGQIVPLCQHGPIIVTVYDLVDSDQAEKPVSESLIALISVVDAAGDKASPRLLANLADELVDAGCAEQALTATQAARVASRSADFGIVSRTYQIEAEAHRLLGNRELALKSHDIATHLSSAARLRLDMGELPTQLLDNIPDSQ